MAAEIEETASKTTDLIEQPHGGGLLPGGKKGNRGGTGRPSDKFRQQMRELAGSDKALRFLREALAGEHGGPTGIQAWRFVADRAFGPVAQELEVRSLLAQVNVKAWPDELIHEFTTSKDPAGVLASWAARGISLLSPGEDADVVEVEDDPEDGES